MEFECDVLVWHVLTKFGLTCEIFYEILGPNLKPRLRVVACVNNMLDV